MAKPHKDARDLRSSVDASLYATADVAYGADERATIATVEAEVGVRLAGKPRRLAHSLSVAATAEAMAVRYDVDPWEARIAGTLHDWDKALGAEAQLDKARSQGVDLGVDLALVVPLLHGLTAATELSAAMPSLPPSVFQAVARHTIGAADMTALDMVVFVADAIEPRRGAAPAIEMARAMVVAGRPLADVYWSVFANGIVYVVETNRYLYPGTIDIYNELALRRMRAGHHKRKD